MRFFYCKNYSETNMSADINVNISCILYYISYISVEVVYTRLNQLSQIWPLFYFSLFAKPTHRDLFVVRSISWVVSFCGSCRLPSLGALLSSQQTGSSLTACHSMFSTLFSLVKVCIKKVCKKLLPPTGAQDLLINLLSYQSWLAPRATTLSRPVTSHSTFQNHCSFCIRIRSD